MLDPYLFDDPGEKGSIFRNRSIVEDGMTSWPQDLIKLVCQAFYFRFRDVLYGRNRVDRIYRLSWQICCLQRRLDEFNGGAKSPIHLLDGGTANRPADAAGLESRVNVDHMCACVRQGKLEATQSATDLDNGLAGKYRHGMKGPRVLNSTGSVVRLEPKRSNDLREPGPDAPRQPVHRPWVSTTVGRVPPCIPTKQIGREVGGGIIPGRLARLNLEACRLGSNPMATLWRVGFGPLRLSEINLSAVP